MSRTPHSACFAARFAREIPAPPRSGRRVGRGAIPRPVKVDPPFPHAGPARLAVKSKKSPTEVPLKLNPQAERGVWWFRGGLVVACSRFPSGLEIARKYASAFPRPMGVAAKVIPNDPLLVRPPSGAAFQGGYKFASLPTHGASHGGEAADKKRGGFLPSKFGENLHPA